MFTMDNEFAYIITDTNRNDNNIQPYFDMSEEGYNLAFIYNISVPGDSGQCVGGLSCVAGDIGNVLVGGYDMTLQTEMPLFNEVKSN